MLGCKFEPAKQRKPGPEERGRHLSKLPLPPCRSAFPYRLAPSRGPAHSSHKPVRAQQFGHFLPEMSCDHGGRTASSGRASSAAGGAERVRGELLPDAGGGDGVPGMEPGSTGPWGRGSDRGERRGRRAFPGRLASRRRKGVCGAQVSPRAPSRCDAGEVRALRV